MCVGVHECANVLVLACVRVRVGECTRMCLLIFVLKLMSII